MMSIMTAKMRKYEVNIVLAGRSFYITSAITHKNKTIQLK